MKMTKLQRQLKTLQATLELIKDKDEKLASELVEIVEEYKAQKQPNKFELWEWTKAICAVLLTAVIAFKIATTSTTVTIDFPTLLSLFLAMFSVGLSTLFYFKATDTSNAFYDNTYKFTKDIAELLIKIESGFGERLRNLDEGYSSMRNYFQSAPSHPPADVAETKVRIETERQEEDRVRAERDKIVKQLIESSQLQKAEKEEITKQLLAKEEELKQSQTEISKLNRRLTVERVLRRSSSKDSQDSDPTFSTYTLNRVLKKIGIERVLNSTPRQVRSHFEEMVSDLPHIYIKDLEERGFYNAGLTLSGAHYLRRIAEQNREE